MATSNTDESPYIEINGNLVDGSKPSQGPVITLGTKSNSHYQSLLPIEMFHLEFRNNRINPQKLINYAHQQIDQMRTCDVNGIQQQGTSVKRNECEKGVNAQNESSDVEVMDISTTPSAPNISTDNNQFV